MTVFLCGFMGCGKSTVGARMAKEMDCPFVDMDSYIEEKAGMTIPEIFEKHGEPYFRDLETEAIRELAGREGVIACGGGAMLRNENAKIARAHGIVLMLDVPFNLCYQRIANTDRPIVRRSTKQQLYKLYEQRKNIYRRHSSHILFAVYTPDTNTQKCLELIKWKQHQEDESTT
ncbi:MAG: shikimate kinase [Oscillospiraceae bacterium]